MWKFVLLCVGAIMLHADAVNIKPAAASSAGGNENRKRSSYSGTGSYAGSGPGSYAGSGTGSGAGSYASAGGFAGGFAGAGGGGGGGYAGTGGFAGGYNGDYNDFGGYGNTAFGLSAGFIDPYEFHQRHTAHILAQNAALNGIASTYSTGDSSVTADASLYPDDIHAQFAQQQAFFDAVRRQSNYNNNNKGYKTNNRYAPSYAAAAGSFGPDGFHQTAHISPANPAIPNIHNRFSSSSSSGPGGYKGVSVSSFSSSADVNGKRQNVQGAQTTINDNGKVTSYRVHN